MVNTQGMSLKERARRLVIVVIITIVVYDYNSGENTGKTDKRERKGPDY